MSIICSRVMHDLRCCNDYHDKIFKRQRSMYIFSNPASHRVLYAMNILSKAYSQLELLNQIIQNIFKLMRDSLCCIMLTMSLTLWGTFNLTKFAINDQHFPWLS